MTAFLSFTGITSEDDGDYSCIIITGNRGFSVNTIRVIVNDPSKTMSNCITYIEIIVLTHMKWCFVISIWLLSCL